MPKKITDLLKRSLLLPFLCLNGCYFGHEAMKSDHVGYDKVYAESCNEQLLLNLARLANDDPVHFVQLGSISSGYTFSTGAGFTPSYAVNSPSFYKSGSTVTTGANPPTGQDSVVSSVTSFFKHTLTLGGSANVNYVQNPIFQFLPLTGTNLIAAVLTPIPDRVFYTFYDQGYPADLVARTMVESVKHVASVTNKTAFTFDDITDITQLTHQLKVHDNSASKFVWDNLTDYVKAAVTNFQPGAINANQIPVIIVQNFNSIVENTNSIYNPTRFKDINLRQETVTVLQKKPQNVDQRYVNRLLIEDTFPGGLVQTHSKTNYEYWVNDPTDKTYPQFLDFCSGLRSAQISHSLTVDQTPMTDGDVVYSSARAGLTDVVAAVQIKLSVKCDTNTEKITVTKPKASYEIVANPNLALSDYGDSAFYSITNSPNPTKGASKSIGFIRDTEGPIRRYKRTLELASTYLTKIALKMRTVEASMFTVAKQEVYFRKFILVGDSTYSTNQTRELKAIVAKIAKQEDAVSQLLWSKLSQKEQNAVVSLPQSRLALEGACKAIDSVITNGINIYGLGIISNKSLRSETIRLLHDNPTGAYLARLNRLLLEDAYPNLPRDTNEFTVAPPYPNVVYRDDADGPYAIITRSHETFNRDDIKDLKGLIEDLKQRTNLVSLYLWNSISNSGKDVLTNCDLSPSCRDSALEIIVKALNNGINDLSMARAMRESLRTAGWLAGMNVKSVPLGASEQQFMRRLIEAVYADKLSLESESTVRPLMTLTRHFYEGEKQPYYKLVEVTYGNAFYNKYAVGDPKGETQDQTVFTMLSYLLAQTAVSTQDLPVQQTIRLQ